jgi:ABC-type glycerol-3-phosphate transport system substrate-binding protein
MARTTRRTVLQTVALSSLLATPFVRGAYGAGKLSVGFWDHWVPGANVPLEKLCHEWADKEKVDLKVDFITSNGDKDLLTAAAEAQARTGHDILGLLAWYAPGYAESLEPVDDVMAALIEQHGPVSAGAESLSASRMAIGSRCRRRSAAPCRRPARGST